MQNWDIIPLEAYAEFGNPSGHVMMGYIVVTYFTELWLWERPLYSNP